MDTDEREFAARDVTPFDVEIVIESAAVINALAHHENAITSFSVRDFQTPFDLSFRFGRGVFDQRPVGLPHDGRRVAAEFLAIALIQNRIGILILHMIEASQKGLDRLDGRDRFFYDRATGNIGVTDGYISDLFDLSRDSPGQHPFFFDVNQIGLSSPVRARSSIKAYATAILVGTRVIAVPIPAAAPTEMTIAQSLSAKSLLDGANVAISAATLGFTIYTHYHPIDDAREKYRQKIEDEIFDDLRYEARHKEVRKLQTILKQMGLYDGKIDGIWGFGTEEAVKALALSVGLPGDTPRDDPQLLRILSHRASKSRAWQNLDR